MGRKRKQVDPENGHKSNLPPCRVCDAPGAGFHYGANTCEACKGFFHRSLKLHEQYRCEGEERCAIEHGKDKLCQKCRYQKCLAVGMGKEAIKTGRYTSVKRTNDILEVKKLQETGKVKPLGSSSSQILQLLKSPGMDTDSGSQNSNDSQAGHNTLSFEKAIYQSSVINECVNGQDLSAAQQLTSSYIYTDQAETNSIGSPSIMSILAGSPMSQASSHGTLPAEKSPMSFTESTLSSTLSPLAVLSATATAVLTSSNASQPLFSTKTDTEAMSRLFCDRKSVISPCPSTLDYFNSTSLPLSSSCNFSTPSLSVGPRSDTSQPPVGSDSATSPKSLAATHCTTSPMSVGLNCSASPSSSCHNGPPSNSSSSSSSTTYLSSQLANSDLLGTFCDSCGCNLEDKDISLLYQDKDKVVRMLVEAHEYFVIPVFGRLSPDEQLRQQVEHVENCRLHQEIFGKLPKLPDHEYDLIYETTGLDTDGRQQRFYRVSIWLENQIRGMVKFAKAIPGFGKVATADKVNLVKYSRQEFCLFSLYTTLNSELKVMRGVDNEWKCENELIKAGNVEVFRDFIEKQFKFCKSLQKLNLTEEEQIVIKAILVMAPDRSMPVESELAHDIHWHLVECLIHILARNYPNPNFKLAQIMSRITEARTQTENAISFIKNLKIEKYSKMLDNPLLREVMAGIIFDFKEDEGGAE
ncbi:unnamed protein product [Lymnaea stagnalis]|uniref:Uncharacterized protein n=1 Tax=Lymnaea stagnalis TaxID=6523 RepID=A0AAV2H3C3_LYMST